MARVRLLKSTKSQCNDEARKDRDPFIVAVEDWRKLRSCLDAMILKWQSLEDQLACKVRGLKIGLADACQSDIPEAKRMRALDARIAATQRKLMYRLGQIRCREARTLAGAIAKVRLGLEAQGKFDWQENARELIEEGIDELNLLIKCLPAEPGQTA